MLGKGRCLRAIVATLGLIASISAGQLVSPGAAQAHCNGNGAGNTYTRDLIVNGVSYARETPVPGTCNLNNDYRTIIQSFLPGFRASLWFQNDGVWSVHYGPYTTAPVEVTYSDNNSHSLIHLCVNDLSGTWYCGWNGPYTGGAGQVTHNYFGTNTGF